jgi:hypothetical protein
MLRVRVPRINKVSTANTIVWIKVGGVWRQATVFIKVGGVWKQATPFIKVSGTWK